MKHLLESAGIEVEIHTTQDFGLESIQTEENGKTLAENAEIKARAYFGKVDVPKSKLIELKPVINALRKFIVCAFF